MKTRYITEMGMGTDVHGADYTKAARRAVSDAIRHSSLNFFRALGKSPGDMRITVRIGVQAPAATAAPTPPNSCSTRRRVTPRVSGATDLSMTLHLPVVERQVGAPAAYGRQVKSP